MLIGISGKMRVGKDTVAEYIVREYGFREVKFSEGIKEIYDKYHYKDDNGIKPREELQGIGQSLRRVLGEDVWVHYTLDNLDPEENIVVSDVRQDNEFLALRERGAINLLITTSKETQVERMGSMGEVADETLNHETEHINENLADIEIVNDSTLEDLYKKLDAVLQPMITGRRDLPK